MCLGMDHIIEVFGYCVLGKSHCVVGWGDVCFHWVVFLFGGVLCCLYCVGFFPCFLGFWDRKGGYNSLTPTRYVLQAHLNRKASSRWCLSGCCHVMCLIWRAWANTLLLFRIRLFCSSFILQEINAQKHVNLQFWSQKVVILVSDCCVKTISVLIKVMLRTSDIAVRTVGYDLGVVVLTVSSVKSLKYCCARRSLF